MITMIAETRPITEHIGIFIAGGGLQRIINYMSKKMPPPPPGLGWWGLFAYMIFSGLAGHDISSNAPSVAPAVIPVKP